MNITRVDTVGRPPGILHCPACGWQLGASTNPAVGYLAICSGCKAPLTIRIDGTRIFVSVKA